MSTLPADVVMSRVHIERLSFTPEQPYSAIEAAIHLNRYMLVREFCKDRRVLDAGCGEGYGSFLMAERWGAAAVTALDISQSTIDVAKRRFPSGKIEYLVGECESLDQTLDGRQFDVIVALETIEHLRNPAAFLRAAQRVLARGGVIVLSCPNDHWYYRDSHESNPFHIRKFHFDEFRELTEAVLGRAVCYLIGAPLAGYSNVAFDSETVVPDAASMRQLLDAGPVAFCPALRGQAKTAGAPACEGVAEHEQFSLGVGPRSLGRSRQPGPADFDTVGDAFAFVVRAFRWPAQVFEIREARCPHPAAGFAKHGGKRHRRVPRCESQRFAHVGSHGVLAIRNERPIVGRPIFGGRLDEGRDVVESQRLQADMNAFQDDRAD